MVAGSLTFSRSSTEPIVHINDVTNFILEASIALQLLNLTAAS